MNEYLYLEHDGKLLLVDNDGNGPQKPVLGRINQADSLIRLPTVEEVHNMGEIEEAKWFTKENALRNSVSLFDKEAIMSLRE